MAFNFRDKLLKRISMIYHIHGKILCSFRIHDEVVAVVLKKEDEGNESRSLISIMKRMILSERFEKRNGFLE